jgi:UDP-2,3-diacylglucosamine hydrolase
MIYFISDVHLGVLPREEDKLREEMVLSFLSQIKNYCSKLFILGDFFDYWFEYKYVVPKHFYRTLAMLGEINLTSDVQYLMGNHDFGHPREKGFFETELGIKVIDKDIERTLYGKKFYLSHGDGKSYNDLGYRIIKKLTRNPTALHLYSYLHPDMGIGLASHSSRKSRGYTDLKNYGSRDGMRDFAERKIKEGADFVVMGHRHRPTYDSIANGHYINLGDWIARPTFGRYDGNRFDLLYADSFIDGRVEYVAI